MIDKTGFEFCWCYLVSLNRVINNPIAFGEKRAEMPYHYLDELFDPVNNPLMFITPRPVTSGIRPCHPFAESDPPAYRRRYPA